jgi:hypothetical protein
MVVLASNLGWAVGYPDRFFIYFIGPSRKIQE